MPRFFACLFLIFTLPFASIWAQTPAADDLQQPADAPLEEIAEDSTKKEKKGFFDRDFIPLPIVYYSPETSLAFGALTLTFLRLDPDDTLARTSNIRTALVYTLNKQFVGDLNYTLFFSREKYQLRGSATFVKFPEFYYGVGDGTPDRNEELIDYKLFNSTTRFLWQITDRVFLGPQLTVLNMYDLELLENSLLRENRRTGYRGGWNVGLGFRANWDSRDKVLGPQKGHYAEFSLRIYEPFWGSDFDFEEYELDLRKYFPLDPNGEKLLAAQAVGAFYGGEPPFHRLALLGGGDIMRGYYRGRYRDQHMVAVQTEYRQRLFWRIGLAAFVGAGNVAPAMSDFSFSTLKYSYGGGLRFLIHEERNLNLRVDLGFNNDGDTQIYLNLGEAF